MDILCPKCGEPWENDSLHDLVKEGAFPNYREAAATFRRTGCAAFSSWGAECSEPYDAHTADLAANIYDLLGDDMDGAASTFHDLEHERPLGRQT